MQQQDVVEVANCANEAEAEQKRGILEESGITAFVLGSFANDTISVGTAMGGAKLMVPADQAEKAIVVLRTLEAERPEEVSAWYCRMCDETVEAGFEVCWSCGGHRIDVQGEPATDPESAVINYVDQPLTPPSHNPYATPGSEEGISAGEEDFNQEAEDAMGRAWRASIVGFVVPVLGHWYSMSLWLDATGLDRPWSPKTVTLRNWTLGVNVVALCIWLSLMFSTFF